MTYLAEYKQEESEKNVSEMDFHFSISLYLYVRVVCTYVRSELRTKAGPAVLPV